jgi:viroplasmin and RNaseH domain-containing protein
MTWYVVYRGKKPGVYETWASCSEQVNGYKKNSYKSFPCKEETVASYFEYMGCQYLGMDDKSTVPVVLIQKPGEKSSRLKESGNTCSCIVGSGSLVQPKEVWVGSFIFFEPMMTSNHVWCL